MKHAQQRIFDLITQEFVNDGTVHFLAISALKLQHDTGTEPIIFKVRIALTFTLISGVNPYFDGTDLFVTVTPEDTCFTREEDWADGPPICESSPIELALGWVSELAPPFFVSPEAQEAADRRASSVSDQLPPTTPTDPNPWF